MTALSITTVVPVQDMTDGVGTWTALLGVEPTFVDGDRWAQFDVGKTRIALAGTDRNSDLTGVLIKVDDLESHLSDIHTAGIDVGTPTQGAHETRVDVRHIDGTITTFYS